MSDAIGDVSSQANTLATTTIYLARHGETEWNVTGRCQGTSDIPLNEEGRLQATALADVLHDVAFDAAYTSPLLRARETAEAVLRNRNLRAAAVPEFQELDYGAWQGLTQADWPGDALARWRADPWSVSFPMGESLSMIRQRAIPVLQRLATAHAGDTVFISAHGLLNRILMLYILGWSDSQFWNITQPNGGGYVLACVLTKEGLHGTATTLPLTKGGDTAPRMPIDLNAIEAGQ